MPQQQYMTTRATKRLPQSETAMTNRFGKDKGFTLLELLIVVAVIGILAVMSIPQLAFNKIKAYNSAAISDLKILRVSVETFYSEHRTYP